MATTRRTRSGDVEPESDADPQSGQADTRNALEYVAPVAAVALLGLFAYVLIGLLGRIGLPQQQWDRSLHLLNGVEAVAFAAAGYLFGKEVHRREAKRAGERAETAQQHARRYAQDAASGRLLAKLVKRKQRGAAVVAEADPDGLQRFGGPRTAAMPAQGDLAELAELADDLFPDV